MMRSTMCRVNYKLMSQKLRQVSPGLAVSNSYPGNVDATCTKLLPELIEEFRNILLSITDKHDEPVLPSNTHSIKIKSFVSYDELMDDITKSLIKAGHL